MELLEREYFSLEANSAHAELLSEKKKVEQLQAQTIGLKIKILQYQIEDMKRLANSHTETAQTLEIKRMNIVNGTSKLHKEIEERLGISGPWSYDPDSLEIILED